MTTDQLIGEIQKVHAGLKRLESGLQIQDEEVKPTISVKDAFRKHEVVCLICGKGGFKTLTKHLGLAHGVTPRLYRKQFGISFKQPLTAKSYSEERRRTAVESGLADKLVKARLAKVGSKEAAAPVVVAEGPVVKVVES